MSTGRNVKEISEFLTERGHECTTFYGEFKADYGNNVKFMGSDISHKIHGLTARISGDAGCGSTKATKELLSYLDNYKPDVVHLNNLHGNFINIHLILQYLAQKDIPTVVHLHDCFFFTGGCMHYSANQCYNWRKDCAGCKFLKRGHSYIFKLPAKKNLETKIHLFSAIPRLAVCGVSKWITSQAKISPVFTQAKIITNVYNWIDLDVFKPQSSIINNDTKRELNIENKQMLLGVASDWNAGKGLNDFLALSDNIMENQVIVLVGKMPPHVKIPHNIIHIEATDDVTELVKLYSAADIFVHLSKEETFGKVIAESLACGTPAIVYNSTAMPEIINTDTGVAVKPGDIQSVVNGIQFLKDNSLSDLCRKRAIENFSQNDNCQKILDVYNRIVNQ